MGVKLSNHTKKLKLLPVFSITMGSMISSGIFILPAAAYLLTGPSIVFSYILGGIFAIIGSLSMVELATAMPKSGGIYFFASRSLGGMVGTLTGILMWIAIAMKSAFAIYGFGAVISLYTGLNFFAVGAVITIFYALLNIKGVKEAAIFDMFLVSIIVAIIIIFIFFGYTHIHLHQFRPFITHGHGFTALFATTAFIFISFGGVMNICNISEEIENPKRDIPIAIFSAIAVITVIYACILIVAIGVLPGKEFTSSINPIADAGRYIFGKAGFIVITIAALLAFSSCANSGIMSSSRYPMALSRDGFAPSFLKIKFKKTNTPVYSIIVTACLILAALTLDLTTLVHAASAVIITSYIITDISVIILRLSKINNYKPTFKTPFFPFLQIISVVIFTALLIYMGAESIKISIALIAVSFIIYLFYAKKNKSNSALMHLIEKLMNKKLTSENLEEELKEIVCKRDNIIKDDFDNAIEDAIVVDFSKRVELKAIFEKLSEQLKNKINLSEMEIDNLFYERENQGSTAITDDVAIPHIIIESENVFEIAIARCMEGIRFGEDAPNIKLAICIIGSKNNRNRHLKALSAIAQIVNRDSFMSSLKKASTEQNIKDLLILSKRKR